MNQLNAAYCSSYQMMINEVGLFLATSQVEGEQWAKVVYQSEEQRKWLYRIVRDWKKDQKLSCFFFTQLVSKDSVEYSYLCNKIPSFHEDFVKNEKNVYVEFAKR